LGDYAGCAISSLAYRYQTEKTGSNLRLAAPEQVLDRVLHEVILKENQVENPIASHGGTHRYKIVYRAVAAKDR
jgi:hypothetical protein